MTTQGTLPVLTGARFFAALGVYNYAATFRHEITKYSITRYAVRTCAGDAQGNLDCPLFGRAPAVRRLRRARPIAGGRDADAQLPAIPFR